MKVWDNAKLWENDLVSKCFHFDRNANNFFFYLVCSVYVPCSMTNYVMDVNNHFVDSKNCIVYI